MLIFLLTLDCEVYRVSAARRVLPKSAVVTKCSSWRSSMLVPAGRACRVCGKGGLPGQGGAGNVFSCRWQGCGGACRMPVACPPGARAPSGKAGMGAWAGKLPA